MIINKIIAEQTTYNPYKSNLEHENLHDQHPLRPVQQSVTLYLDDTFKMHVPKEVIFGWLEGCW